MTKERQRRIAQRLAAERRRQGRRRTLSWLAAAVILAVLASAVAVAVLHRGNQAAASGTGQSSGTGQLGPEGIPLQTGAPLASIAGAASGETVNGIRCEASEQVAYHIHTHLAVFLNGAPRSIPYGIGVVTPAVTQTAQGLSLIHI